MQNSEHKMDELFRSKLSGFEVTPPSEVWDRIAESMGHNKKKRRALLIWSFSGAASLLLAFLLGWYMADKSVQSESGSLTAKIEEYRTEQKSQAISEPVVHEQLAVHFDKPQFIKVETIMLAEEVSHTQNDKELLQVVALKSLKTLIPADNAFPDLAKTTKEEEFFSAADRAIIEANLLAMNESKEEQSKGNWAVGVNASPVYRFNQPQMGKLDAAPSFDVVQNQVPSTYQTNVSGGLSFAYETGSRIDIISGLNYSEVAQNTGDVALSFLGHNWLNDGDQMNYLTESGSKNEGFASNNSNNGSNNMVLNTEVGLANINLPQGATVATAKAISSLVPEATQNYDYKQQARYVEVPLLMRYRIIDSRLGLNVLGGINTNVLVANTVKLESQSNVVATGKIEGLRPLTWSSSLGMGLNYDLTERLNLNFEPTLKIQLNSLNTQSYYNAKPYTFGVFSGVSYRF